MTAVANIRSSDYGVLICRPSKSGNPFSVDGKVTREKAIQMYEVHVRRSPKSIAALPELAGKRVGCVCKQPHEEVLCHGDVLIRLLDESSSAHD